MNYKLPPLPANLPNVVRRIRACEGEVAAQVVFEHALNEYAIAAMEAQGVPDVADLIAGALYDFLGHLTSMEKPIAFGANEWATPAVDALVQFAEKRGLTLNNPAIEKWTESLASAPPAPHSLGYTAADVSDAHKKGYELGMRQQASVAQGVPDGLLNVLDNFEKKERSPFQAYLAAGLVDELRTAMLASAPPAPQVKQCEWTNCPTRVGEKCCNEQASVVQQSESDASKLATAIAEAATKAGITDSSKHCFSGPQLLMLLDDMAEMAKQVSEAQQEPVAYVCPTSHATVDGSMEDGPEYLEWADDTSDYEKRVGTPLYTHPAPQAKPQPLSEEKIREAVNSAGMMFTVPDIKVARAVEAAHGITKDRT